MDFMTDHIASGEIYDSGVGATESLLPVVDINVEMDLSRSPSPLELSTPKTPNKRRFADSKGTPSKKTKTVNRTPQSAARNKTKICDSADDLPAQDKMLLSWKDDGRSWPDINAEWERVTGKKPGKSTLPVRYKRLKDSLASIAPEDVSKMIIANKKAAEEIDIECKDLQAKKWTRVAKYMEDAGAASYGAAVIEKHWKKMEADGSLSSTIAAAEESSSENEEEE